MTVGRPVVAPEVSAHRRTGKLLFEQRLPPHGRLASPGLRSAANLRLALPCGTVGPRTCLVPPLDGVGASPDRDVPEPYVPLDTQHLSMPLLCRRRPENPHCCWLSDPRVRRTSSEEETLTRASMNLRALLRCFPDESGLQPPPGGRRCVSGCPETLGASGRVEPLQALNTPGKASLNT